MVIMVGFITEAHLAQAEEDFPGISRYFAECRCKPRTFLELVALFDHWCEHDAAPSGQRELARAA